MAAVAETSKGVTDTAVVETGARERRVLITEDKDFGDLAIRRGVPTSGIILVRTAEVQKAAVIRRLLALIGREGERLHVGYAVVTERRTRFRLLRDRL